MTDTDKIRFLADLAGWTAYDHHCDDLGCIWLNTFEKNGVVDELDYPHSLDAIARDLLPLLREKGWNYGLYWRGSEHSFVIWHPGKAHWPVAEHPEPARAAFEAIYEAFHGGEE